MSAALLALALATPAAADLDALWATRDAPGAAARDATAIEPARQSGDYALLWRVSRWECWQARLAHGDERKHHAKAGWDVGDRARKLKPDGIEAKYWTALNVGFYGSAVSPFQALLAGIEGKHRDPLLEVTRLDPECKSRDVEYVGAEMALGHFYYNLPWPKHDGRQARTWLQRAIAAHPENLHAHFLYADVIKNDDRAAALRELALVLSGDESYDPPDARYNKAEAQALIAKLSKK